MRSLVPLAIGLLLLGVLAFFCVRTHAPSIESDLTMRSNAALSAAGYKKLSAVVDGRDVTVAGTVASAEEQTKALALVGALEGVRHPVSDAVEVHAGPSLADCTLTAEPKGEGIDLTGVAPSAATVDTIQAGTKRALNSGTVEVAALEPHPGMGAGMRAALPWLHRLSDAKAVSTARETVITGSTDAPSKAEGALLALLDASPEGYVGRVDLQPSRAFAPAELMAVVRPLGTGAVLSGVVATAAQRDAIVAKANELFQGPIHSSILVGDVEGVDFLAGIGAGIPIVQGLSNGRLQLTPLRFFLSGLTPEGMTFDASQLDALRAALPPGAKLETDVATPLDVASCQQGINDRLSKEKIQFETAKADIKPASDPLLIAIGSTLRRCPGSHLAIEGHTDSQGDEGFNLGLSNERSRAVFDRLIRLGMPAVRASAEGYGETRPVGDNTTADGRAQNRRIEFRLEETAK